MTNRIIAFKLSLDAGEMPKTKGECMSNPNQFQTTADYPEDYYFDTSGVEEIVDHENYETYSIYETDEPGSLFDPLR